ncbi:uncharacterized protein [Eurosta solidaginis]|uniref:uncharacterized protein isoform X1 n=1 Tax=Eurosta solidaginis TaxID=178769 RepID=UPI003530DDF8
MVFSETSKIYDPLGMVAPIVVLFKVLFQESWCYGLGWDDPLPEALCKRWCNYMGELHHLKQLQIPRYISYPSKPVELLGFSDASTVACAAVVYCRVHAEGSYAIKLIAPKTRVAPLKPISVPRLELNAALLLTKLITLVKESLTLTISNIVCWTDSEIVLHWLSAPPRKWATFVRNRTAEILDVIPRSQWRHVRSEDNPADCASRGILPTELIEYTLWWSGPSWFALPEPSWPSNTKLNISSSNPLVLVEENHKAAIVLCANEIDNPLLLLSSKISSWWRLIRIVAYCIRFINKKRRRREGYSDYELQQARIQLLKGAQAHAFFKDIDQLQNLQQLHCKSTLIRYSPFIDESGVLRVGGRIKHVDINYNIKFPIILPKDAKISLLIVRHKHEINMHAGVEATFALVRQKFWILGCRNLVRKVIFGRKTCFLQRRTTSTQLMGNLPSARVQPSRRFLHCGLDYAGPVRIKYSKTRNPKIGKAWFAIFVCLSTKALHIELESDLTTDAFLASFRRFIARRGKPSDLYSDNGTTFHSAKRALNELQRLSTFHEDRAEVAQSLANEGVNWHFIPPSAPHLGGLWETGVRSIKLHLR